MLYSHKTGHTHSEFPDTFIFCFKSNPDYTHQHSNMFLYAILHLSTIGFSKNVQKTVVHPPSLAALMCTSQQEVLCWRPSATAGNSSACSVSRSSKITVRHCLCSVNLDKLT